MNKEFTAARILASKNRLIFSKHFLNLRKNERDITAEEIKYAIVNGFIFADDNAYKAVCKIRNRHIGVVFKFTKSGNDLFVITAYNLKKDSWDVDSYKNWLRHKKR